MLHAYLVRMHAAELRASPAERIIEQVLDSLALAQQSMLFDAVPTSELLVECQSAPVYIINEVIELTTTLDILTSPPRS